MTLRGRFARLFVSRVFALMLVLGLAFLVWGIGSLVWLTLGDQPGSDPSEGPTSPVQILEKVQAATSVSAEGSVTVAPQALEPLEELGFWLQVLDERGDEIFAWDRPAGVPRHHAPGELVLYRQNPREIEQASVYSWFSSSGGRKLTWVLGRPVGVSNPWPGVRVTSRTPERLAWSIVILFALGIGVVALMALLFGRSLSRPMGHMMDWLGNLASGRFEEPVDRNGHPASIVPSTGKMRSSFATYREVFESLESLTQQMKDAEDRRERLARSRDEWMSGVSHDLKTPLSSVRGYADLLASDYDFTPEEVRTHAAVIQGQSAHMLRLLDDLQLTFRLRADALPLTPQRIDAVEFVREAVVDLANDPRAEGREVVFEAPEDGGEVFVEVDPAWFRRALGNLMVNAAVHNEPGTTVRVSVARLSDEAAIEVADDGRGMDAETMSRLFDRYYRGTATSEAAEGSGLGMAIARQLIEANGGTISVESEVGAGTTVRVTLRTCVQRQSAACSEDVR